MSWVRVDCDIPMDGRLVGSGHAWAWPAVVARAKAGDGRILMRECSPRVMAYLWGPSLEAWQAALDHLLEVGLLIVDGDAYLVAGWDEYQRDNTGAERQRRHRASRRNGDVTLRHVTSRDSHAYSTVQDRTGQDSTVAADAATTRAHAPAREEAAAATTTPKIDDQLNRVAERWRLSLRGKTGAAPLVVGALDIDALDAAVKERGAEYVTSCIDRAAEVAGGSGPSLALLKSILRDGVHPSKPTNSGQTRSKSDKTGSSSKSRMEGYSQAWSEDVEASRALGGVRVTKVPGVGYVPTAELTAEQIAAVEAEGFAVI